MKITPNRFVGVLVAMMTASALLSFTGVDANNPTLYLAGFALFVSVAPLIVLQSWFSGSGDDNSDER